MEQKQNQVEIALSFIQLIEPNIRAQSYQYIADKINEIFDIDCTVKDVEISMCPTLEEEIEDLQLIYERL
jgi:hypothetical protein